MGFIGTDQSHDINKILDRARVFLEEGERVQIEPRVSLGELTKGHPHRIEYELYVCFKEE